MKAGIAACVGITAFGVKMFTDHSNPVVIFQDGTQSQILESSGMKTDEYDSMNREGADFGNADKSESMIQQHNLQESVSIPIFISGEIHSPGVYEMTEGSYLYEILTRAGELTEHAAREYLHLVYQISEPVSIYIPSYDEIGLYLENSENTNALLENGISQGILQIGKKSDAGKNKDQNTNEKQTESASNNRIDLNLGSAAELITIPGIGENTAAAIIKYREDNGSFSRIEDVMLVPGIKERKFQAMKDFITVGGE